MMKKLLLSGIIMCLLYSPAMAASTAGIVEKGNRSYSLKDYGKALELYEQALTQQPDSALINFNAGAARYKSRDYQQANAFFEKALVTDDKDLETRANYDLGNSKYMLGLSKENSDLSGAVQLLEGALNNYRRTTEITPADEDAKVNYKIVEKKLKEFKEKLKTQPQQQNKGGQKQKQENKAQSGQQGQENKQDQQQQNKQQENKQGQQGRENKQGQEENKSGQEKQEEEKQQQQQGRSEQERKEQAGQQEQQQEQAGQQKEQSQAQAQSGEPEEMSKQEANMLLEGYRREEMPAGMLNDRRKGKEANVSKDW